MPTVAGRPESAEAQHDDGRWFRDGTITPEVIDIVKGAARCVDNTVIPFGTDLENPAPVSWKELRGNARVRQVTLFTPLWQVRINDYPVAVESPTYVASSIG